MKKGIVTTTLFLVFTALGFAQTPQTFGAWSVYQLASRDGSTTLLQTSSLDQDEDAPGQPVVVKLDAICKKGKLYRVAVETEAPVPEHAMNLSGEVLTTPVSFQLDGNGREVQSWAVLDSGHTLSPYSELRQGKMNRSWIERLGGTRKVTLHFQGESNEDEVQVSLDTEGLAEALSSVGCTY